MNEFLELLKVLLSAVITAAVPILTAYLIRYLSKVFEKVSVETEQSIVSNTIQEAMDIVMQVVVSTSQTYVDSLKAEGKFGVVEHEMAFQNAKATILSLLSKETQDLLQSLYTDLDTWLEVQIEASVKSLKNN